MIFGVAVQQERAADDARVLDVYLRPVVFPGFERLFSSGPQVQTLPTPFSCPHGCATIEVGDASAPCIARVDGCGFDGLTTPSNEVFM